MAGLLAPAGCGRNEATTAPTGPGLVATQSQLTGVFVGGVENGLIDVTVATAALAPAMRLRGLGGALRAPAAPETTMTAFGTMSPDGGGAVVNLIGAYDTATDSLRLHGQGYTVAGLYLPNGAPPRLEGRFSSSSSRGSFTVMAGARSTVHVFCATYEDSAATMWGTLDLAVAGSDLAGFHVADGDTTVVALQGTANGSGITRALAFAGADLFGNGSWNTTTGHVAGVWASPLRSGVWSGDRCLPGTTGSP